MKNFNIKLTASLVGLFIGFLLIVLGNKQGGLLALGFFALALSIALFAMYKVEQIDAEILNVKNQLSLPKEDSGESENEFNLEENKNYLKLLKRNKRSVSVSFYTCAFFLFVCGILFLI